MAVPEERDRQRLVAYVATHGGVGIAPDVLRAFLADKLPAAMVPAAVVSVDAFPLTPTGKIDRRALPAPPLARDRQSTSIAARTPLEAALAGIWSEVLAVPVVGITDNFFDLGGHSLSAMQLVSRARERLEIELTVSAVLVDQTIERLAATIERAQSVGSRA
jgi:acyl carrier protein